MGEKSKKEAMSEQPEPLADEEIRKMRQAAERHCGRTHTVDRGHLLALLAEVLELRDFQKQVESEPPR